MGVMGLTDDNFLADRMFQVFDSDNDMKLTFMEFASSLAVMIRGTEDEKLALSFQMLAGQSEKGVSPGIRLEDFQHLVKACNTMMSSLVAPVGGLTSEADAERLFCELASCESEGEEKVITLDAYKAAAQESPEFLACLGLEPHLAWPQRPLHRRGTKTATVLLPAQAQREEQDGAFVPYEQVEELERRIHSLQRAAGKQKSGSSASPAPFPALSCFASPTSPAPREPDESWWGKMCGLGDFGLSGCNPPESRGPQSLCLSDREQGTCGPFPPSAAAASMFERREADSAEEVVLQDQLAKEIGAIASLCSKWRRGREQTVPSVLMEELQRSRPSRATSCDSGDADSKDENRRVPNNIHSPSGRKGTLRSMNGIAAAARAASRDTDQGRKAPSMGLLGRSRRRRLLGPKKGLAVHFGHENWNLVLSMMIGIRMGLGRTANEPLRELQPVDYGMKEKFSILPRLANIFDSEVSKSIQITRFIDYAPMVFQRIRSSFGILDDEYVRSVGPEQLLGNMVLGNLSSLSELSSEGKSGAFFYYTADGKYMMKTVSQKEHTLLKRMLKQYSDHIEQNPATLLVRFLGLHCLSLKKDRKASQPQKLYFVVMGNMFNTPFEIHRRYDLKGSWVGRVTKEEHKDPSVALKDLDFLAAKECIRVGEERRAKLVAQLDRDSAFLCSNNIIDYSLLLGIYELGATAGASENADGQGAASEGVGQVYSERTDSKGRGTDTSDIEVRVTTAANQGLDIPFHQADMGGMLSSDQKALYFLGVIDILTPYDGKKHLEHWFKAARYDRRGVSCCPPAMYAERFTKFMAEHIC
eukprot:TRINITY_DN35567_c0_g2_i1.p1 TRINITY_DN35567_c0_g2~~TRINITY_DN35567_c0_g2_i1.p1  ORF type:complete len:894 (+),score=178.44 TRINITY_DN35567_c0_g2_i1:242-2683(+)